MDNEILSFNGSSSWMSEGYTYVQLDASYTSDSISINGTVLKVCSFEDTNVVKPIDFFNLLVFDGKNRTVNYEGVEKLKCQAQISKSSYYVVTQAISQIIAQENPFVYKLFFNRHNSYVDSLSLNGKNVNQMFQTIINLVNIDGNMFEKLIKTFGDKFIQSNLDKHEISVGEGSKLHQMLSIPKEIMNLIKDVYHTELEAFQSICSNGDGNDAIYLVNFLNEVYGTNENILQVKRNIINKIGEIISLRKTNMPILLTYLFRQTYYNTFSDGQSFLSINAFNSSTNALKDTFNMYFKLFNKPMATLPSELFYEHLVLSQNIKLLEDKPYEEEEFVNAVNAYSKYNYIGDKYRMVAPKSSDELVLEGSTLRHCVASYGTDIAQNGVIVMFLRKNDEPDTPFVTVEYDKIFGLSQIKCFGDKDVNDEEVLEFANEWERSID